MPRLINSNHRTYKRRGVSHTPRPFQGSSRHQTPQVRKHWRDSTDYIAFPLDIDGET